MERKNLVSTCLGMMKDAYEQAYDMETYSDASFFEGKISVLKELLESMGYQVTQDNGGRYYAIDWHISKEA